MEEKAKKKWMEGQEKRSIPGGNLSKQIINLYNSKSIAYKQNALKGIFESIFEVILPGKN